MEAVLHLVDESAYMLHYVIFVYVGQNAGYGDERGAPEFL